MVIWELRCHVLLLVIITELFLYAEFLLVVFNKYLQFSYILWIVAANKK